MLDRTGILRLLLVEDNADDAELILRELRRSGFTPRAHRVQTEPEYVSAVKAGHAPGEPWDVILADYTLPDFSGLRALHLLREHGPDVPIIIVSGAIGEETAVQAMREGASDYLLKDRLGRLATAIRNVIEKKRLQEATKQAEEKYRRLFEDSVSGVYQTSPDGSYLSTNSALARMLGYDSPAELMTAVRDLGPQVYVDPSRWAELVRQIEERDVITAFESELYRKDRTTIWVSANGRPVRDEHGTLLYYEGIMEDISARKQAEEALHQLNAELERRVEQRTADLAASETKFRTLFDVLPVGVSILDDQRRVVESNPALARILQMSTADLAAGAYETCTWLQPGGSPVRPEDFPSARALAEQRSVFNVEIGLSTESGQIIWTDVSAAPLPVAGYSAVVATADLTEHKRIEGALRDSEEKFSKAFHASAAGIVITATADGRILDVNDGLLRLIGYDRVEVIGRTAQELGVVTPAERDRLITLVRAQGHIRKVELSLSTKSGEMKTVLTSVEAITLGDMSCMLGMHFDITERKRIEADLRQSEERFAKAFHSSPIALTITREADDLFVDVNEGFQSLFGYRREEVIGHRATEFNVITNLDERAEMGRQFRERGSIHNYEVLRRTKSGELRKVLLSADTMELDGEAHILTTMLDITARKQAEAALAREHDLLQLLMDNIPDTIYFKDRDSRFTRINLAQAQFLGVGTPEVAIGKTDADFQPSHLALEFYAEEQRLLDSGQPLLNRLEFNPTADGEARWLSTTKVPLKDASGQVFGLVGVSRDVTERLKSEEALQRVNQQLAERVNELSRLNQLAEALQACQTIEDTYPLTAQFMSQLSSGTIGALYVVNAERTRVTTATSWGKPVPEPQAFGLDDCWALRTGRLHLLDQRHPGQRCEHLAGPMPAASICMPVLAQGQALGVLHLRASDDNDVGELSESTQQMAQVVAESVALTWVNLSLRETLRQQAICDPLTGLFNRRFMEESLVRELHRAARSQQGVGIIMMDVDRFKRVNDRFGHAMGDSILRELGQLLQTFSRGSDIPCRFGGEEFLLILPEASLEITRQRAEQIRQGFRQMKSEIAGNQLSSTSPSRWASRLIRNTVKPWLVCCASPTPPSTAPKMRGEIERVLRPVRRIALRCFMHAWSTPILWLLEMQVPSASEPTMLAGSEY